MVDVNQELDNLAIHLKNVTLQRDASPSKRCDDASCCGIDLIFQGLKDTKLKRKSLKILEQNFKAYPSETQQTLMQKISKRVENEEKFVLLKQILDLLDGPQIIRQSLIIGLEKMCTLAMETIQKTHPIVGESRSIQGVGKDILDSELFNAIKICVSVFQNYGTEMMNDIFGGSSDQTWSKWVQELITRLLAILRGKTFQKEIIGMAGIALAHVVNNQPKLEHSLQLASLIIEKSAEITEHHIGPLRIRVESCFAEDSSVLGKIMAYNGLLSVCNPNILLADLTITFKTGSILMGAFTTISESCSESLHAAIKYSSFQVLNSWMECITRITMPVYHEKAKNKESLFQESSTCCKKLLDLIWDNRESMIDGVPKFVHSIFKRLIELHESENITLGKQLQQSELFEMIAAKLLQDPWYMKGRYSLLCEFLPNFDSSKILQLHPSLASEICKCFGTSTLQSIANECYRSIVLNARSASSLSSGEKFWTPEYWSSVWMELLLNLLKEENLRAVHNAVLYFIPTTLQHVDGIFERIKDSISKELQVLSNCLEKSPAEIMSIRSKLLFGYCSVFKLARKSGLATLSDIDTDILKESLVHVNDDVRAAAISVLCYNNKTTEPITELEETLLWDFLPVNLNCASSSFRQSFFVSLKAFFARVRDSSIMMLRNYTKESNRNQNHKREAVPFPERLEASIDLVEKIVSLALRNLFPGASFQRRRTGLQIFYTVLETFSSPSDAVKKGRTVESLKSLTDWVSKNGRWKFITLQNLKTIVSCLEDQHDEIRELAMTITNWFHFETMKIDDIEKERFCKEMLNRATALMSSPKIRDAESGAILMEFIAKRFTNMDDFSLNEEASSSVPTLLTNTSSHLTITELVLYLVNKMHDDIKKSENDVLHSAVYSPVFGYTLAARRCFCSLVQSIKSSSKSSSVISEDTVKSLALLSSKVVHTCIPAIKTAMSVFSKKNEEAQGTSPSFADINDSLGRMLLSCKSYTVLKDSIGNQHCLELLSSFCWLNIKAASLFLGEIGKILSLQSLSSSQKKAVITDDLVNVVGRMFKETLINCRHKGVIENSCTGFQIFCKSLSSENLESLCDWLDETVAACDKNDLSSSITKRSAGLPMFVQSIISSCVSLPLFNLGKYMKWLIEIAKRPVPSTGKMETDLPQVQAMNILRGIYRDSSIGTEVLQFAEDGLMLSVEGFSSSSWAIRNAAQILLGALVPRMLGQRVTQADKSYHNSASPDQFFSRYPALEEFFLKYLRLGVDHKNQLKLLPALVPILTLLSKLRPCDNERYSSVFFSLLDNLLSSYVITVRNLAASSLVVFLPLDQIPAFAGQTILKALNTNCSCNYRHGLLLVIKKLLGVAEDDLEVLDLVLTKGIWPHFDSLLNFNHGKCTEYFSRSSVFEIASMIVSFMPKFLQTVLFYFKISS